MSVKTRMEPERAGQMLLRGSWDGAVGAKALAFDTPGFHSQLCYLAQGRSLDFLWACFLNR